METEFFIALQSDFNTDRIYLERWLQKAMEMDKLNGVYR